MTYSKELWKNMVIKQGIRNYFRKPVIYEIYINVCVLEIRYLK